MTYSVYQLAGLFLIYAFLGWCTEVCFSAMIKGQVVNRGFLNGPVCPIYGVGMLGVLILLEPVSGNLPVLFLGGMILCTVVELVGGWILERVFDTRWWDYSQEPFNLDGYICLRFSVLWGLAVAFVVRLIHPALFGLLNMVPRTLGVPLEILLYALFLADLTVTLVTIAGLKRRLRELERITQGLHAVGDALSDHLGNTALAADARLDEWKETGQEKMAESREKVSAVMTAGQEKMTEGREKVSAVVTAGQEKMAESRQKLGKRVSATVEDMQARRRELEARRRALLAEAKRSFTARRLSRAFPDGWRSIRQRLGEQEEPEDKA